MNKKIFLLFLVFALMVTFSQGWTAEKSATCKACPSKCLQTPCGCVIIQEEIWYDLADEPAYHAQKAHDYFLKKDFAASAQEIRRLNNFIIAGISVTSGDIKKNLENSAKELDALAGKIAAGEVKSINELDNVLAKVSYNLAKRFKKAAHDSFLKKETKKTGKALKASMLYLENAALFLGHKFETEALDIIKGTKNLAGKLISGTEKIGQDTGKLMDKAGTVIDNLGKKLEVKKSK